MDVWFCIGRNLRREAHIALEGILIRSNARSPKRARKTRAFPLTLTYMDVGFPDKWRISHQQRNLILKGRSASPAHCSSRSRPAGWTPISPSALIRRV